MAYSSSNGPARLTPLHDLKDFKVADRNLDVRNWEVIGADGQRLGKVDDLIVDRELMKVRYLDIDVDKDRFLPDTDARHLLVPIGAAHLDDDNNQVFLANIDQNALTRFPFYRGGAVDSDLEYRVMHAFTKPNDAYMAPAATAAPTADFYQNDHFNEERFYQKNQNSGMMNAGGVSGGGVQDDIATIERLKQMLDQGTITQEEFAVLKRKAIGF
ncbi:PRC-barrel domain-containing protein [Rufibacter sp. LB8]|uniref:PRC-barrel domain-containing protein n=1 Tax=Rufibacter sp. LB8 TaxID=2777781 RepID=UPI00178C24BA|nr:PRC-barrel domain-containing protein [Rufibacter sp. LB8]